MGVKRLVMNLAVFLLAVVSAVPLVSAADTGEPEQSESLAVMDGFEPGIGPAVGRILKVSGTVVVVHEKESYGFNAFIEMDLFKGDTLHTGKDGTVAFKLNDGSFISLSPSSELAITRSVYAPEAKSRSSLMNMVRGNARFVVKKFVDARHSEFKIKTKTAVAGVRGSDFIIMSREAVTEIMALENTALEVFSLTVPDAKPVILADFERTTVRLGARPEEARRMDAEEVDRLMREFRLEGMPEASEIMEVTGWDAPPVNLVSIIVPQEALIRPDFQAVGAMFDQGLPVDDMHRSRSLLMDQQAADDQHLDIFQQKSEDVEQGPLPDFPGTP